MGILGTATDAIFAACKQTPSYYRDLLGDFNPRIGSDRVDLKCPSCGDKSAWLTPGSRTIRCNHKSKCGAEISVLAASIGINAEVIDGEHFREAVLNAATITGIELEQTDFSPEAQEARVPLESLEAIWQYANRNMLVPGSPAIRYLLARNFDPDFIAQNFGHFGELDGLAIGDHSEALASLGIEAPHGGPRLDPETGIPIWEDRLIIPCRDAFGKIVAFVGRCLKVETRKQKYIFTTGYKKNRHPFGLDRARRQTKIIAVEGHLDALKLHQHGLTGVVAVGGCHISAEQLLLFKQHGAREVIAFFDADQAGDKGIEQLLDTFDETLSAPELFIGEIPHGKDPDAYCDLMGINSFVELSARAPHAHKYRARHWFKSLERDSLGILRDGELPRYVERCADYLESASPRVRLRQETFIREMCALSGIDRSDIKAVRKEISDARRKRESQTKLRLKLGEALGAVKDGNLEQGRAIASGILQETEVNRLILPTAEQSWNEVENYFTSISKADLIGVRTGFKFIDESLCGARRLITIAGATNVGKTTLLGQLALQMAANHDTCVLFLSFEMERWEINSRLLALQSQIDWRDLRRAFAPDFENDKKSLEDCIAPHLRKVIVVDENDPFIWSPENVIRLCDEACEATGTQRCALIIDDFEGIPAYFDLHQIQRENAIVRDLKKLRRLRPSCDPTFIIMTLRKAGNQLEREIVSSEDVKGSNEKTYRSDVVMIWNRFSDRMLYEKCALGMGTYAPIRPLDAPMECNWKTLKDDIDVRRQLREANEYMLENGFGFSQIDITKVRDGMSKGSFDITVRYRRNQIVEGLHV